MKDKTKEVKDLNHFLEELKGIFDKYNEGIPLYMLINSANLFIDTLKKELKI